VTRRVFLAVLVLGALALAVWRAELFTVQKPGEGPRALNPVPAAERRMVALDTVLPAVPIGMRRLRSGDGVTLIHYWAPWQQDAAAQAAELDSLSHLVDMTGLRVAIVCFDPFPSVARYVARRRLRVNVLLDRERRLRDVLPCPSIPYTYVLDRRGAIAVSQPGEVSWFAPQTRRVFGDLLQGLTPPASAEPT
jgi:hypothetical protein